MAPYLTTPSASPPPLHTTFLQAPPFQSFPTPPRILIIGAGSRGTAYAEAALQSTNAVIAAVCEPVRSKREAFGRKFIWSGKGSAGAGEEFAGWREWVAWEEGRRAKAARGEEVEKGIDAVFVCVLDELHEEVVCGVAGLGVHVCCEKPMSTRLESCARMVRAWRGKAKGRGGREPVFGICHVLRYSPHNMLLRHLVRERGVVGEVLSVQHTEPVGWWHFSHSYVRGNWRKESTSAPSLLTKSCHDIDFLLWMLCTPTSPTSTPHLPSLISSTGSLKYFRKSRKPAAAGNATNCLSCAHEPSCAYSAKKIYLDKHLAQGVTDWPVKIVNPDIEDIYTSRGPAAAEAALLASLGEDWDARTPAAEREARNYFGRCVWDGDNDVVDDQVVSLTWDDDAASPTDPARGAKTALFHMIAHTEKQCERRGRIYGTHGEISYDSTTITVHDFASGETVEHVPHAAGGGHGGGDAGLVRQFLCAVSAVEEGVMGTGEAQRVYLGCDIEEAFRSHAVVFAAEEARVQRKVVEWGQWWEERVGGLLG